RALWALHAMGGLGEVQYLDLLDSPHEHLRGWAVRLALEKRNPSGVLQNKLAERAGKESAPPVRLSLASGLQRLPVAQRWSVAAALVQRVEDAQDTNLSLMIWYGIEPLVPADPQRAVGLLEKCQTPLVREFLARRLILLSESHLPALLRVLGE